MLANTSKERIIYQEKENKMSIWDRCWFCEDFDEENDCCMYHTHPDDCEEVNFDSEEDLEN